ncbi:MAG: SDR family oxidoreductase [Alphaproteobacteria bacterium]|nr:SDR family oxidoreductase [Alphaproteobacteria bacterium]
MRAPLVQQDERLIPVALVTGAARRIGREIALDLARSGFDIALHYRGSESDAEATAQDIRDLGRAVHLFDADLAVPQAATDLVTDVLAAFGELGVVVNNASIFERDDWDTVTRDSWSAHMAVNLESPMRIIQAFAKALPDDRNGVAINIIDQRVFNLTPHFISYTASKSGLWTLTRTLALALAPRIRVAAVGPGPTVPSPRQEVADFDRQWDTVPLRRRTEPTAIAKAVRFIIESPSYTGQMIALDGGEHMGWQQAVLGCYIEE